jgi:hypothetical protein
LKWDLNSDLSGQCNPLGNAVCIDALTQVSDILFHEVNTPATASKAYRVTQTTSSGSQTSMFAIQEAIFPQIATNSLTDTVAIGQDPNTPCSTTGLPMSKAGTTCTQVWAWDLIKQP